MIANTQNHRGQPRGKRRARRADRMREVERDDVAGAPERRQISAGGSDLAGQSQVIARGEVQSLPGVGTNRSSPRVIRDGSVRDDHVATRVMNTRTEVDV